MYDKAKAIEVIKSICKENSDIQLRIGEIGSAGWTNPGRELTIRVWQDIRSVSVLSEAFEITQKDIEVEN